MLSGTLLSRLAADSFFVASDILYCPTSLKTDRQFAGHKRTVYFKPVGTLDEIEEFDIKDFCRDNIARLKGDFSWRVLNRSSKLVHAGGFEPDSHEAKMRLLIATILYETLPVIYYGSETNVTVETPEKIRRVNGVFERLTAKFGQAPEFDLPLTEIIEKCRQSIPKINVGETLYLESYPSGQWSEMSNTFPSKQGDSLLSKFFGGLPYLVDRGDIYRLSSSIYGLCAQLRTPEGKFKLVRLSQQFGTLYSKYEHALENQLHTQALAELETKPQNFSYVPNINWYVDRIVEQQFFEWDNVGLFIMRFAMNDPTCYVYRRLPKFAVVDPSYHDKDDREKVCYYFGETRIGISVRWVGEGYDGHAELGKAPVVIDFINHPAGQQMEWSFRTICNSGTYPGDAANRISEGIATLRNPVARNIGYYFCKNNAMSVAEAKERGFEVVGMVK